MGGLEIVDPRYVGLWERARDVLGHDARVADIRLSGSVASETADRWSDLDVQIVAHDDGYEDLLETWPSWLSAITPTVFARTPLAPFIINAVTDQGLTLDLAIYRGSGPDPHDGRRSNYTVGMLSSRQFPDVGDALEYAVAEQLRGLAGPFISLVQREEHLRHLAGVPHILGLLTTVLLAETGAAPPAKHWNRTFTAEQLEAVAALPPVRATRSDIVAFGLGVAELLIQRARPLYPRYGLTWPAPLATVAAGRLRDCLNIEAGDWLR